MEIIEILRSHVNNKEFSSFPNIETFINVLDTTENELTLLLKSGNGVLHEDEHISRCIDIEGLDGCGKSTLADELLRQLTERDQKVRLLHTPPDQLLPFRSYFDAQVESIRRPYYNLGNLIVSLELKRHPEIVTVLDRYWPSTIAYQLAKVYDQDQIDIVWPNYLVQPALIVYVYVDEAERCRRIALRSALITGEEKELAAQAIFRQRLDYIYRNHIPCSQLYAVDSNQPTNLIAKNILDRFQVSSHQ